MRKSGLHSPQGIRLFLFVEGASMPKEADLGGFPVLHCSVGSSASLRPDLDFDTDVDASPLS